MEKCQEPSSSSSNYTGNRKRTGETDEYTAVDNKRSSSFGCDPSDDANKQLSSTEKVYNSTIPVELSKSSLDSLYIAQLAMEFQRKQKEKGTQKKAKISVSTCDIKRRLAEQKFPCNLLTFTCMSEHCGRTFISLEVLAFHISYSHQIVSTNNEVVPIMCFLCGSTWSNSKQRNAHLQSKHRLIGEEHNDQCMQQANPVIAPNAPKALRLKRARELLEMQDAEEAFEESVSFVYNSDAGEDEVPFYG